MVNNNGKEFHSAPNWLTKEYLEDVFRQHKKSKSLKINSLEIIPATQKGDNYASVMTRIKIGFDCCESQINSYIVKTTFEENKFANDIFLEYKTFQCEMNMYESVLPKLTAILQKLDATEYIFPEVIFVDWQHTAIIMEDLAEKHYTTADRIERLDMRHTKVALEKMAKMHAASVVLNRQLANDYLQSFDRGIINRHSNKFYSFFHGFISTCADLAISWGGEYAIYGRKLKELLPVVMKKAEDALDLTEEQFNVLNHGDFWTNNIMYKYNKNGGIDNAVLIDFQFSKWTSPAWDLHYFFNTALQEELRHKQQVELFYFYHQKLTETLKKLNYEGKVPDMHQFRIQMAEKEIIGMVITMTSQVLLINESTEDADFDVLIKTDERSLKFRKTAYSNPKAAQAVKNMLPIYDRRGLLNFD